MQRSAFPLIIWCMAIGSGSLLFPASAAAFPTSQNPLVAGTEPLPDFSGVARDPDGQAAQSMPQSQADSETAAAPTDPGTAETKTIGYTGASRDIPCLSSFVDDEPSDSTLNDGSCDDPSGQQQRLSLSFGERIAPGSGILGEFDGLRVDYRLTGGLTLNGIAGYPVLSSQDKFNATRQIYGVSATTGKFARSWELNSYWLERQDGGRLTSREIGGSLRYLRSKRSVLVFLDYDAAEHALGGVTTSGALKLPYQTTITATLDVRNSRIRKRQQKYLQSSMAVMEGWTWDLPTDRIAHFTEGLSEPVTTLVVGMTHAFSDQLKLSGSVARLDPGANNRSTEVATPSEYFYRLKLNGRNLMFPGDNNMLDLSHRVTESSHTSSAAIDTRYSISRRWNVSPRLRTDYRDNPLEKSTQWVTSPSVRMEYHWRELYGFKIEAGGEWLSNQASDTDKNRSSYYVNLGYKGKF